VPPAIVAPVITPTGRYREAPMIGRRRPELTRRLLLGWLVGAAVLLMHAAASTMGCSAGEPAAPAPPGHTWMADTSMAGTALAGGGPTVGASAAAVGPGAMDGGSWSATGGSGEMCVSLPAGRWLAGLLPLLPLVTIGGVMGTGTTPPLARRGHRWRAPPICDGLLTRICVSRT
jgi:hypothetical protein